MTTDFPPIDFDRLLSPSIAFDGKIKASAAGTGGGLNQVEALLDALYIWSRIDDLSEDIIDHLGWHLHIEGWAYAAGDPVLKRYLVKNFFDFHRYKGTEHGLALYWRTLIGRCLLKASPPHKSYLSCSLTPDERAAFEFSHPEIRSYPFMKSGTKQSFFPGDPLGEPGALPVFAAMTDAMIRVGLKVEMVDPVDGTITPLRQMLYDTEDREKIAADIIEVRKPGIAAGQFCGYPLALFSVDHMASERFYTIKMDTAYTEEVQRRTPLAITPSLSPINGFYDWRYERGLASGAFLANRWPDEYPDTGGAAFCGGGPIFQKTDAPTRIYKCLKLFDAERVVLNTRSASTFAGTFRLGAVAPHTAEVAVDTAGKIPPGAMAVAGHTGGGFLYTSDAPTRIYQIRDVGKMAARMSDKILLAVTNRRIIRNSTRIKAGGAACGEYRLEVI